MHRLIEEHLEEVLADTGIASDHPASRHLETCQDCRELVEEMRQHSAWFADLAAPEALDPHPGFYARVMDRIEDRRGASIWDLFFDSVSGRRLPAMALALALLMGVFLVSTERQGAPQAVPSGVVAETYPMLPASGFPDEVLSAAVFRGPGTASQGAMNQGDVLFNLVTYREH